MPVQPATTTSAKGGQEYIPVSEFIRRAKERGVNFGFGDPYNRLRYYTKIGLLPHMTRRAVEWNEATVGHYPESALDTLEKIEDLKKRNLSNIEIEEKLEKEKIEKVLKKISTVEVVAEKRPTYQFAWVTAFVISFFLLGSLVYAGLSPLHRTRLARAVQDFKENAITNLVATVLPQLADQINGKIPEIIDVNDILSYDKDGNLVVLSHKISVPVLRSTVKKGQAPLEVDSDTKVKDLNADLLDDHDTGTGPGDVPFLDELGNLILETASGAFDSLQALGRNIFGPSEFKGDVDVEGDLEVGGKIGVSGGIGIGGDMQVEGNASIAGDLDIHGTIHNGDGHIEIGDNLDIDGYIYNSHSALTLDDDVIVGGELNVKKAADFAKNVTIDGTLALHGVLFNDKGEVVINDTLALYGSLYDPDSNLIINDSLDVNQKLTVSGNAVVSSTLAIGAAGTQTYNLIADSAASASGAMDSDLDLYIQEDLEVDGTAYLSGLTSSGNLTISNANPTLTFEDTTAGDDGWNINVDGDSFYIYNVNDTTNYLTIDGEGNVGIGTTSPSAQLDISSSLSTSVNISQSLTTTPGEWDDTYGISVEGTNAVSGDGGWSTLAGLYAWVQAPNVTDNFEIMGVLGSARHSSTTSGNDSVTAYGGYFSGDGVFGNNTSYGVRASGGSQATNYTGTAYGVYGWAASRGSNPAYGLYGYADATETDYGLYADVNPTGDNSYAGYFARGRVQIEGDATATTPDYATGNGELFVLGDIETDAQLYVEGTGNNYFAGNVGIGTTGPDFALDVSGDIRIEAANKLYFGGTGATDNDVSLSRGAANRLDLGVGDTLRIGTDDKIEFRDAAIYIQSSADGYLDLVADSVVQIRVPDIFQIGLTPMLWITGYHDSAFSPEVNFQKARGTEETPAVVQVDDMVGRLRFYGYSAAQGAYWPAAVIKVAIDAEPDTGGDTTDMPGRISFYTTPDGSGTTLERLRIDNAGKVWFDPSVALDTNLYRSTTDTLKTDDSLVIEGNPTASSSKALEINNAGAVTGTGYGAYITKTGASTTNVGLYVTASGATNNYAAIFDAGNVGIGTVGPSATLEIAGSGGTDALLVSAGNVNFDGNLAVEYTSNLDELEVAGQANFANNVSITGNLSVDGTSNLDEVDIQGNVNITGDVDINAGTLNLDGSTAINLGVSSTTITIGQSSATITIDGQLVATRAPTEPHTNTWAVGSGTWHADDAPVYINPASATGDSNLLGLAVGGSVKFAVDAEGDIYGKNLILDGAISTATTTITGDLTVEGNTTLGDTSTDTLTFDASTLAIPNNLNIDSNTLFIDASSNSVGIGTTGPSATLEIAGSGGTDALLVSAGNVNFDGQLDVDLTTNLDELEVAGQANFAVSVDIDGNLDVGYTANLDEVDIDGNVQLDGTFTQGLNGTGYASIWYADIAGTSLAWSDSSAKLTITGSAGTDALHLAAGNLNLDGALDVEYTTNLDELEVAGVANFASNVNITGNLDVDGTINLDQVVVSAPLLLSDGSASAPALAFSSDPNSGLYWIDSDRLSLITGGTVAQGITIDSGGNVGIGTISPSQTLTVIDATEDYPIGFGYSDVWRWELGRIVGNGNFQIRALYNGSPNSTALTILQTADGSAGNVGIGTESPNALLDVEGTVWLRGANADQGLFVKSDGNVGIGTTSPASALDVSGTTTLDEVTISGNATFAKNIDVDGTANLDQVDIDGTLQIDATVTVGVDDSGYDVRFYGATSGYYFLWDENINKLVLSGTHGSDVLQVAYGDVVFGGKLDVEFTANLDELEVAGQANFTVSVDIDGNLDVDYTANLDEVDIDGNVQLDGNLTVGTDGSGYTVTFHSDNAGDSMVWSDSSIKLTITGSAGTDALHLAAGNLNLDGILDVEYTANLDELDVEGNATFAKNVDITGNLSVDGTSNLDQVDIDGTVQVDATVTVGVNDTGYDVKFYGATASTYLLWDQANNKLQIAGSAGTDALLVSAGNVNLDGQLDVDLTTNLDELAVAGNATFAKNIDVGGTSNLDEVEIAGNTNIVGLLDVDYTTNLDELEVAGVANFASNVNITGNLDVNGTSNLDELDVDGVADFASNVAFNTNIDVGGTANLDQVDIAGTTQIDATVTVGVNDTGYDVKFYGATASTYLLWDQANNKLQIAGSAGTDALLVSAGNVNLDGQLDVDLTTNLDEVSIQGNMVIGVDGTGYDVTFYGATSGVYMLWDETANQLQIAASSGTDSVTVDHSSGVTMTGTARHARRIQLNAEYAGAVLTTFYGADTDSSITGTLTADIEANAADNQRTYYEWSSSEAGLQYYTVAVRITLPQDFSAWATSNALQVDFVTETDDNTQNRLDVYVYIEDDVTTTVASDTANADSVDTWGTITIDDSVLDDGASTEWDAAGETAIIYLRMGSLTASDAKHVRVGDIKLNYLSKW